MYIRRFSKSIICHVNQYHCGQPRICFVACRFLIKFLPRVSIFDKGQGRSRPQYCTLKYSQKILPQNVENFAVGMDSNQYVWYGDKLKIGFLRIWKVNFRLPNGFD